VPHRFRHPPFASSNGGRRRRSIWPLDVGTPVLLAERFYRKSENSSLADTAPAAGRWRDKHDETHRAPLSLAAPATRCGGTPADD
jgi:hypothetical protein